MHDCVGELTIPSDSMEAYLAFWPYTTSLQATTIFYFQPIVIPVILRLFLAYSVGGVQYLYFQMDIPFSSTEHTHWKIAGLILLAAFVLIAPAKDAYKLFKHKKEIMQGEEDALREFGFIINNFCPECFGWDLCILARKMLLAIVITMARPHGTVVQVQLALMVSIVALAAQIHYRPFKYDPLNTVEFVSIGSFIITAWLGVLMSLQAVPEWWKETASISIVVVNAAAVFYLGYRAREELKAYWADFDNLRASAEATVQRICGLEPAIGGGLFAGFVLGCVMGVLSNDCTKFWHDVSIFAGTGLLAGLAVGGCIACMVSYTNAPKSGADDAMVAPNITSDGQEEDQADTHDAHDDATVVPTMGEAEATADAAPQARLDMKLPAVAVEPNEKRVSGGLADGELQNKQDPDEWPAKEAGPVVTV
jgi:hypothetical protein